MFVFTFCLSVAFRSDSLCQNQRKKESLLDAYVLILLSIIRCDYIQTFFCSNNEASRDGNICSVLSFCSMLDEINIALYMYFPLNTDIVFQTIELNICWRLHCERLSTKELT